MSLDVNDLPTEILQSIFRLLCGKNLLRCRNVCNRWREVVDGIGGGDQLWQGFCENEYYNCEGAYTKSCLPWRELYNSLNLWENISYARMTPVVPQLSVNNTQHFELLPNGVIALAHNTTVRSAKYSDSNPPPTASNVIVYYNVETFAECDRINLDFFFKLYKENETVITCVHEDGRLCVIPKLDRELHFVGQLARNENEYENNKNMEYSIIEHEVFFKADDNNIYVSAVEEKSDAAIVTTKLLGDFAGNDVVAFSYDDEKTLLVLTTFGEIYKYKTKKKRFKVIFRVHVIHSNRIIYILASVGFDWASNCIFQWMTTYYDAKFLKFTEYCVESICRFGSVVIFGNIQHKMHVYCQPYNIFGYLSLYGTHPDLYIDLDNLFNINLYGDTKRLDVYEMVNAHRVIVLLGTKLVALEFVHEDGTKN